MIYKSETAIRCRNCAALNSLKTVRTIKRGARRKDGRLILAENEVCRRYKVCKCCGERYVISVKE